jgi:hypothetical protein
MTKRTKPETYYVAGGKGRPPKNPQARKMLAGHRLKKAKAELDAIERDLGNIYPDEKPKETKRESA